MKPGAVLIGVIVSVVVLATGGAVYVLAGTYGEHHHYRKAITLVRQIQQLSSDWSIETARVRSDPLTDFDTLAAFIPRMTRLKESLSDTLRRIPDLPARLSSDIRSYTSAIDAKEENIERFKTGYAVVRNSTRYLPLAATNVTQQAQDAKDDDLVRRISLLTHDMNSFLATPTDTVGKRLMDELQRLREASVSRPLPLANALVNLIAHAELLLGKQEPTTELFHAATSNRTSDIADRLADSLEFELDRQEGQVTWYERVTLAGTLAVLALLWTLLAVQQRSRHRAAPAAAVPAPRPAPADEDDETLSLVDTATPRAGDRAPPAAAAAPRPVPADEDDETISLVDTAAPRAGDRAPPAAAAAPRPVPADEDDETISLVDTAAPRAGDRAPPAAAAAPRPAPADEDDETISLVDTAAPRAGDRAPPAAATAPRPAPADEDDETISLVDTAAPRAGDRAPPAAAAAPRPAPADEDDETISLVDTAAPRAGDRAPPAAAAAPRPAPADEDDETISLVDAAAPRAGDRAPPAAAAAPRPVPADEDETIFLEEPEAIDIGDVHPAAAAAVLSSPEARAGAPAGTDVESAMMHGFLVEFVADNLAASASQIITRMDHLRQSQDKMRGTLQHSDAVLESIDGNDLDEELDVATALTSSVRREVNSLADLARRLSSFSKVTNGRVEYGMVDVNACIDEVIDAARVDAVAMVGRNLGNIPEIFASRAEIRLLLSKIVENSVRAVRGLDDRAGVIKIDTARKNEAVLITIIDNGIGIAAEKQKKIFDPFYTSRDGAIGIGLTLAGHLTRKYRGAITVNSLLGQGTVTRVTLPVGGPAR